jgi:hypothetical protein
VHRSGPYFIGTCDLIQRVTTFHAKLGLLPDSTCGMNAAFADPRHALNGRRIPGELPRLQ